MNYLRAFISGLTFPSIVIPIGLSIAISEGKTDVLNIFFIHLVPLIWGAWNFLYFAVFKALLPGGNITKLLLTGGALGLILAIYAIFWLHLPEILGIPTYLPLIAAPVAYALVWWLIVNPLNHLVGIKDA